MDMTYNLHVVVFMLVAFSNPVKYFIVNNALNQNQREAPPFTNNAY